MTQVTGPHFQHALQFREDTCIGCSHCMNVCPTEAIRVSSGKARLIPNRCIDCGECYRVCPVRAIVVEQDDFEEIYRYPTRVALIPGVFTGQFPDSVGPEQIISAIYELGFTHVAEVEEGVEFLCNQSNNYIGNNRETAPLISSFCPAIVRLIQVKFPSLTGNIIRLKAPLDITALTIRYNLSNQGIPPEDIGIFYVTPCAAKIVAVKNPVGEEHSAIDGVLNMNFVYNKVFRILRQKKGTSVNLPDSGLTSRAVTWSLTHGEADHMMAGRSLAIDQINNVIEFLEKIENEEISGVGFLELRACDESCAGGILCPGNRFLTVDRLRKRARALSAVKPISDHREEHYTQGLFTHLQNNMELGKIQPRSMMKLDDQVMQAMIKMKRIYELNSVLPQVDCGICGSPSCKALSEDIVQHNAHLRQCIFVQRILEQNDQMDPAESMKIMAGIWSDQKLDKNKLKDKINDVS